MSRSWIVLAVTLAIQAMISAAALVGPVLAPDIAPTIGLRAALVGIQIGLIYAAAATSSLFSGNMIRRLGAVRLSQLALLFAAAGLGLSLIGTALAIAFGALLIGIGYGAVTPASSHLLARSTPKHRMGLVFSLKQTGVPLGGILAGLALPPLTLTFGWRVAVSISIALCLLVALSAQSVRGGLDADRSPGRGPKMRDAMRTLLADPALRRLALVSFVFAAMQLILTGYLVTFLTEARGLSLATAGTIMAISQAAGVTGRLAWGWCADRLLDARTLMTIIAALSAICSALFAIESGSGTVLLIALTSAIFGAAAIGWNGVFLAEVARIAPEGSVGAATGAALFMTYAGVVAGPPVFAGIVSNAGYIAGFSASAVVMAAMAAFLMLDSGHSSHDPEESPT
ncbi:MFS transporter [Tropicimonas sp. IMCC34011]|uniref:MFS transporter n=1 Tax=Tropicimonas sp. IMCC34011 TaxID=2248759 RepID=UPI000E22A382|nr:MFS transporter [Tropicimonas sp. IMCC34011]